MGDNLKCVAKLQPERPASDHGAGTFAITLADHDDFGTVYEIGWQKLMAKGSSLAQEGRRLYLLCKMFWFQSLLWSVPDPVRHPCLTLQMQLERKSV